MPALEPIPTASRSPAATPRLTGEVVYTYAFDIAYELKSYPHAQLLGQPVATFSVDTSKRSPKQLFFYRPQMVRMPPVEKLGPNGMIRLDWSVKLLSVGAISVTVRVPFDVEKLDELIGFHDLQFSDGSAIDDEARRVANEIRQAVAPYCIRPHDSLSDEEAYTIFCLHTPHQPDAVFNTERWLEINRRQVAAVLTQEEDVDTLSDQEVNESTSQSFSYSRQDLVVFDWDAALLIDEPRQFDQLLYIIELTNVQLTELEAYDRILDDVVDRAYADLNANKNRSWGGARTQRDLREIRIDLARLTDELSNISKFFGDFHAGRLYQGLASRFHLSDWRRVIDHKIETLDHIYGLLAHDRTNRWMLILEATIVFLILFDIIKSLLSP